MKYVSMESVNTMLHDQLSFQQEMLKRNCLTQAEYCERVAAIMSFHSRLEWAAQSFESIEADRKYQEVKGIA